MKIFDSSQLIAIFNHINRPDVFEDISQLGHELVIPHYVMAELHDTNIRKNVKRLLKEGKIKLLEENSIEEIREFQEQIYKLKDGETDVILTCQKLGGYQNNAYCILDDKDARRAALKLNVKRRGLWGLLDMLEDRGIKSPDQIKEIKALLKDSNFRSPRDST